MPDNLTLMHKSRYLGLELWRIHVITLPYERDDVFSTAIAVAPVTHWGFYDSIYTERFMRRPQDNPSGYNDNSPINWVKHLKGNLLLCHGTADDNVHVQNTYELSEALVQANKQFDMQIYTNRNHSIYGGYTRYSYTLNL